MAKLPRAVTKLVNQFERLPGIGPKSAQRLVFYLLHNPEEQINEFARRLKAIKTEIVLCSNCHQVAEKILVIFVLILSRSITFVCRGATARLIAMKFRKYYGLYHVLHGSIDPLNNVGPDQLFMRDLLKRP